MPKIKVVDLDMSGIKLGRRKEVVARLAKAVAEHLEQLYPAEQGYKHTQKKIKPSKEEPDLVHPILVVARGLRWGYVVRLSPPDSERPTSLKAEVRPSSTLADRAFWAAAVPTALILAGWWYYGEVTSDKVAGAVGLGTGIWLCYGYLIDFIVFDLVNDRQKQRQETERLCQEIHDLLERDLLAHPDDFRKTDAVSPALESLRLANLRRDR